MSWKEIKKSVNDNLSIPLNQQIRNNRFLPARIITKTTDWVVERSGWYKIICVGAGGLAENSSSYTRSGGSGGVSIKDTLLSSGDTVSIILTNGTVTAIGMIAEVGGDATTSTPGKGGKASGGDSNFSGKAGISSGSTNNRSLVDSTPVTVYIPELSFVNSMYEIEDADFPSTYFDKSRTLGSSILGYGLGQGMWKAIDATGGIPETTKLNRSGVCIVIPLEYTE